MAKINFKATQTCSCELISLDSGHFKWKIYIAEVITSIP